MIEQHTFVFFIFSIQSIKQHIFSFLLFHSNDLMIVIQSIEHHIFVFYFSIETIE